MSAHCKLCGDPIFDEDGQCYGEQLPDGKWVCDSCVVIAQQYTDFSEIEEEEGNDNRS